jgi:branched-chain amino acid transport system ATP-binding protein
VVTFRPGELSGGDVVAALERDGIVAAARGSIRFAGKAIEHLPPHRIARRGIAYVPEDRGIFASLTVDEHLSLNRRPAPGGRVPVEALYEQFPLLAERRRNRGNELSGGEQQMLAIARAIILSPRLLILDEPTEGLAPIVVERIAGIVDNLRAAGMTMLLVEQNYPFAIGLADHVYVLGKGRIRWYGTPSALAGNPSVTHTWLGV